METPTIKPRKISIRNVDWTLKVPVMFWWLSMTLSITILTITLLRFGLR